MKINRFLAMAAIALLVLGTMGAISLQALAKGANAPVIQSQDCSLDQADGTELHSAGLDTDTVELQCGDQNDVDTAESVGQTDTDKVNFEEQTGDQNTPDTGEAGVEAPEANQP